MFGKIKVATWAHPTFGSGFLEEKLQLVLVLARAFASPTSMATEETITSG